MKEEIAIETANLAGFSQAGAPVITRSSTSSPTRVAARVTSIAAPTRVSGRLIRQARRSARKGGGGRS